MAATSIGRTFLAVWFGQLVSNAGTSMTAFALSLWVYDRTGSATELGLIILASRAPVILVSPFAGALIDRWNRRSAMVIADTGAAFGTAVAVGLFLTGQLEPWHLYPTLAISGVFQAFQTPAYSAATTLLVPKSHYARAAGLVQLAGGISMMIAPALGAAVFVAADLGAVFAIDVATYLVAVTTLLVVRFPEPIREPADNLTPAALLREARQGVDFITERRGLLGILLLFTFVAFAFSFQSVLLLPLLLAFTSEASAGLIVSSSAVFLVIGSIAVSAWGGPTNRPRGLLIGLGGMAVGLALMGAAPALAGVAVGIALMYGTHPLAGAMAQAIWQSKVPVALQGRVFAVRQVATLGVQPLGFVLAGPLAEHVFEPMMESHPPVVLSWLGDGEGRGIGLIFLILGAATAAAVAAAWSIGAVRNIDSDLPDIDHAAAPASATDGQPATESSPATA